MAPPFPFAPPLPQLNYSTSWQHLKDIFRGAGSVQHVDIMEGPDGRPKGCAVVWFDSPEVARRAIGKNIGCLIKRVQFRAFLIRKIITTRTTGNSTLLQCFWVWDFKSGHTMEHVLATDGKNNCLIWLMEMCLWIVTESEVLLWFIMFCILFRLVQWLWSGW